MGDYWKNHYNAAAEKFADSPLKQVDRTLNGKEMDPEQLDLAIDAVLQTLTFEDTDHVADLCCGNGLVTQVIAKRSLRVIAVDFSERLIDFARRANSATNIDYVVADVSRLDSELFAATNKFYMRDSISCLDSAGLSRLLVSIQNAAHFQKFFIGGVPDADKLAAYYDNDEKMAFYREREAAGKPHIGNWWSKSEMKALVEACGLKVSFLAQDPALLSAYYRYDCLIERGDWSAPAQERAAAAQGPSITA